MEPYHKFSYRLLNTPERLEIEYTNYLSMNPDVSFRQFLERFKEWSVPVIYNEIEKYKHKEFFWKFGPKYKYLGFYQKFYCDNNNNNNDIDAIIIYEFLNPYTREITEMPVYTLYSGLYIEKTEDPPIISQEMKNEIIYHPYHMFRNGDIVDFISLESIEYFNL